MTPSLAQRIGVRPHRQAGEERRLLTSARAAALLFVLQPTVVLVAAEAHGRLHVLTVAGACLSYALAATVVLAYERFGPRAKSLAAAAGSLIVAAFIVSQEHGQLYTVLYTGPVLFFCLFFEARQAVVQVGVVLGLAIASSMLASPIAPLDEGMALTVGALSLAAVVGISLRGELAAALAQGEAMRAEIHASFSFAPAGFGVLDAELRHVRVNAALAAIMELPEEEIVGRTLREAAPVNGPVLEALARSVLETGRPVLNAEIEGQDGRGHHLVSYYPIPVPGGAVVGTAVTDVTHLKDVERRLEETNRRLTVLATTDELTGLPNRRMLAEQLDLALARARRSGTAVAVLCLDLDRFKEVNDTLGHSYGDDMLVAVASKLRAGARDTDVVARLGGDEFVVLLADLDVQDAPELAATVVERIHGLLAEPVAIGPVELNVDASVGVAIYPLDSRDAKGLLAVADAAMYAGKTAFTRVA